MALGPFGLTTNGAASDLSITANGTTICTPITGLIGLLALVVSLRFAWGSGGGNVRVYVQTSLDGGNTWVDIACVLFGTSSEHAILNFSALTPKLTQVSPTDGSMADDTAIDGVLGDRVRAKVVSSGTIYGGNTTLVGRVIAR